MFRRLAVTAVLSCALAGAVVAQTPPPQAGAVPTILVTRQLLEAEHLVVGQLVSLSADPGGAHPRTFRIVGQYEPVPDPMRLGQARHEVRMHLPDMIDLSADPADPVDADAIDTINVVAEGSSQVDDLRRSVGTRLPGVVVSAAGGGPAQPFVVLERFHYAIAIVTVIASSIFLLALMLMLVDERRSTVGVLRLIGFRRRRIVWQVLAEGVVIALAGAAFGVVLSAAFQGAINGFFQWKYDTALVFVRVTPAIALRSVVISVPLGVLATLVSSWSILRVDVLTVTRR
ncbi:MAG: ABC transporter permease [Vicinamibacterales bacterium]